MNDGYDRKDDATTREVRGSFDFDIAVIGAGPAGSATARWLALRGCRVALIEATRFDRPRPGESLAPGVQPLLSELGVWTGFEALKPLPSYGTRSLWGEAIPQEHSHLMSPYACGWQVDRAAFDRMLAQAAETAGAQLFFGTAQLQTEADSHGGWWLRIEELDAPASPRLELRARVLVEASGRTARTARKLGGDRLLFDHLVGVAATFGGIDTSGEGFILIETSPDGWWYSAPVSEGQMMVMLMTDSDLCRRAHLMDHTQWHGRLASVPTTAARIAQGAPLWGPGLFSAASQRLRRREFKAPWIAVGDAALSVDPISGSGVIRALRSARAAAEAVLARFENETSTGIEAYEAERDFECTRYLHERALYYGMERRWQELPFWQRRATAARIAKEISPP